MGIGGQFVKKLWCYVGGRVDQCSGKGLVLETPTFAMLYNGQFTLSTQLTKANIYLEKTVPKTILPVNKIYHRTLF